MTSGGDDPTPIVPGNAVAVIGFAGRFPGARTVDQFWVNVRDGRECVTFFSEDELLAAGVDPDLLARPEYVRARAVIDDIEAFDAPCFGMSAREAEITDPQHRLFLECALEALEHAGCAPDRYRGAIGVFAGAGPSSYLLHNLAGHGLAAAAGAHLGIGNSQDFLATRVAYKLDLKGPAYTVQSACSTSLVAVHLACQHVLNYECDVALAGGVNLVLPARSGYLYQEEGMLSPDGHCRPFDEAARGTVFGSGVGIAVLKRLEAALADGDTIHAIVLGSAVNNDGSLKAGYTAPSVAGQAGVITEALSNAGVPADSITYLEAHGTGTSLGDPIEIAALTRAFASQTDRRNFCALGAVKANIGHLDTAAGIAGFLKTVLALRERTLPPMLHFTRPNPRIDFAASPFVVDRALRPWTTEPGQPRRAGVSAFGVGGTNAHVVLQEPPAPRASVSSRSWHLLPLSARSEESLSRSASSLADYLDDHADTIALADAAFTLQVGRRACDHRRVVVGSTMEGVVDAFDAASGPEAIAGVVVDQAHPVVFMFPGLGVQAPGMAVELYASERAFRAEFDRCCAAFGPGLADEIRDALTASGLDRPKALMARADIAEASLFAFEYALVGLLGSWGVRPDMMIGHGIGEYVCACVAGVFSIEDAARIVAVRGRALQALPPGAMLAVSLGPEELRPQLAASCGLAIVNTPTACVVAGPPDAVTDLESRLSRRGVATRRLDAPRALQSPMVESAAAEIEAAVAAVGRQAPAVPFISNVTGRPATADVTDPRYWARHLRQTIYFGDGIRDLLKDASRVFVEVGPGMTLTTLARQNLERGRRPLILNAVPDARERRPHVAHLMTVLGRLWVAGVPIDWEGLHAGDVLRRVPLPGYQFERRPYWIEPRPATAAAEAGSGGQRAALDDFCHVPLWKQSPLPAPLPGADPRAGRWLVVDDDGRLADALEATGIEVVRVRAGTAFAEAPGPSFTIRPQVPGDHLRALTAVQQRGEVPTTIVFAPGLSGGTVDATTAGEDGFYGLLHLAQAMGQVGWTERDLTLLVLTREVHSIDGREAIDPARALVLGPALVIGHEWPSVISRHVDVGRDDVAAPARLAARLRREAGHGDGDRSVAWRGTQRFVRTFEPARLRGGDGLPARLRAGGVYLLTGGFGGVGATIAEALAADVAARLVLVGRSPMPPREAWDDWVASHAEPDEVSRRIGWIRRLEAMGADVLVAVADVASEPEMQAAVDAALRTFGRIDGVVHAAGVPGGGIIPLKTREAAAAVLRAKVTGTQVLAEALRGQALDFVVLCSSLASLAGNAGQVDYCAANAFLDAWAQARRIEEAGTLVVAVNWDAWRDVGMAVSASMPAAWQAAREQQLRTALSPREGAEVFRRVLAADVPQVAVSTVPMADRLRPAARAGQPGVSAARTLHPRPVLHTEFVEPRTDVEKGMAAAWQDTLGVGPIGLDDNFFDLGGDSLTALRLVSLIQAERGVVCTVTDFYAAPTIRLLAARLPPSPGAVPQPAAPMHV